jgi:hypothetical protein
MDTYKPRPTQVTLTCLNQSVAEYIGTALLLREV